VVEFIVTTASLLYDLKLGTPHFYLSKAGRDRCAQRDRVSQGVDSRASPDRCAIRNTPQLSWEGVFARELGASENTSRRSAQKYQCVYTDSSAQDGRLWIPPARPRPIRPGGVVDIEWLGLHPVECRKRLFPFGQSNIRCDDKGHQGGLLQRSMTNPKTECRRRSFEAAGCAAAGAERAGAAEGGRRLDGPVQTGHRPPRSCRRRKTCRPNICISLTMISVI